MAPAAASAVNSPRLWPVTVAGVLHDRPAEPILFLPLVDQGAVAVKLTHIDIDDHALTLTVEPLTSDERVDLLARIKHPPNANTADASAR